MTITTPRSHTASHGPSATPESRRLRLGRHITAVVVGVGALIGMAGPAAAAPAPVGEPGSSTGSGTVDSAMSWGVGALLAAIALAAIVFATVAVIRRASHTRSAARPVVLGA